MQELENQPHSVDNQTFYLFFNKTINFSIIYNLENFILDNSKLKAFIRSTKSFETLLALDILVGTFVIVSVRKIGTRIIVGSAFIRYKQIASTAEDRA